MSDITFARTRYDYKTYSDYYKLVELSGFPVCYVDEINAQDASQCYIFSPKNGEIGEWHDAKAKIIHWNLERDPYPPTIGVAETWCSDATLARKCNARYVVMGSHPRLCVSNSEAPVLPEYDFAMLSYMTNRRSLVRDRLLQRGLTFAPNAWDMERHKILKRSRTMLHVHQDQDKWYLAPQRWCIAAAYHLPLITEALEDPGAFGKDVMVSRMFSDLCYLNGEVTRLQAYGDALYQFLCVERTFRKCVESAV